MFSERIKKRHRLFWKTKRFTLHGKGSCLLTYQDQSDPLDKWQCCAYWQRKLSNKWNAREFAQKYGCKVPELYWLGKNARDIPFSDLPDHYVIKPVIGHSAKNVFVMAKGVNLMDQKTWSPEHLKEHFQTLLRPWSRRKIMVESFVMPEHGNYELQTDYKCHVFKDQVAAISACIRKSDSMRVVQFDDQWELLPQMHKLDETPDQKIPAPACLDEILILAKRLGQAYETYVRVDFYASKEGCVFGEFAATPANGNGMTAFGDQYLEQYWQKYYPNQI